MTKILQGNGQKKDKKMTNQQIVHEIHQRKTELSHKTSKGTNNYRFHPFRENGVIITDPEGHIKTMNKTASEITEWLPVNAADKPVDEILCFVQKNSQISLPSTVIELINTKAIKSATMCGSIHLQNGKEKEIEYSAAPIVNEKGKITGTMFVLNNITEYTERDKNFEHNNKLNALALLAGGIAHEYNNILTIICGNLAIAKTCECIDEELLSIFAETEIALNRAKDLTDKLRYLSKGSKPEKRPLSIEDFIKVTVQMMMIGSPVSYIFSFQHDLWPLEADKVQLEKVIQTLLFHVKEELAAAGKEDKNGKIKINVKNTSTKNGEIPDLQEGNYIKITLSGNGKGIPKDALAKIFEPSFSSIPDKVKLDLTTAYTIIRRHKGNIIAESREGKGTLFSIFLPVNIKLSGEKNADI